MRRCCTHSDWSNLCSIVWVTPLQCQCNLAFSCIIPYQGSHDELKEKTNLDHYMKKKTYFLEKLLAAT